MSEWPCTLTLLLQAAAQNSAPVNSLVNPLWSPDCALPSMPHIQAVEDVAARDLRSLVTLPLGIPQVQVIINEIYDMQPRAESQTLPVCDLLTGMQSLGLYLSPLHSILLHSSLHRGFTPPGLSLLLMRWCLWLPLPPLLQHHLGALLPATA